MTRGGKDPEFSGSQVEEIDRFGMHLMDVHRKLSAAEARSQAQEKLVAAALEKEREANETQRRFMRVMSHEIRTPMNCVLGVTDLLIEMDPMDRQRAFLDMIRFSGTALLTLINEILDLSKIESGTVSLELSTVPFAVLRDQVERNFRHVAQNRGIGFELSLAPDLPATLITDEKRLQQVLKNLLSNAFKFTPENGEISISGEFMNTDGTEAPKHLSLEVTDTGIGISMEDQQKMFEIFSAKAVIETKFSLPI